MSDAAPILYCRCAYAKVVPAETKAAVLERLAEEDVPFEAVPDLCEMSARKDPALMRYAGTEGLRTVACYPRAVRWLFHHADAPLPEGAEVRNMRIEEADAIVETVLRPAGEPAPPTPEAEPVAEPVAEPIAEEVEGQ